MGPLPPALPLPALPPAPLLVPLLWLTLTVSLLRDAHRPAGAPTPRPASLLLALISLAAALVAAFHVLHPSAPTPLSLPTTLRVVRQAAPSPDPFPTVNDPSPPPSPPPPSTAPVAAPPPAQQAPASQPQTRDEPSLQECGGALTRMQVILLLEFLFESLFYLLRILATNNEDEPTIEISFRGFTVIRAFYIIPVLIINASIVWIGGGPVGDCLPVHPELQIAYAHLIFYAMYCILIVILGLYRLTKFDSEKDSTTYYTSETRSYAYPPTRTSSLYDGRRHSRSRSRRAHDSSSHTSSSTDEPRFHVDCGCCAINI